MVAPLLSSSVGERVFTAGFVALRGVAAPHSVVVIAVDGVDIGRTQTSKYGAWASDVEIDAVGQHQISLRNVDPNGEPLSESRNYPITIISPPEALPVTGGSAADGVLLTVVLTFLFLLALLWRDRTKLLR